MISCCPRGSPVLYRMMAVDKVLSTYFRSKRSQQKSKFAKQVHFRICMLDLISEYIKHQSRNPIALKLILPLLEFTHRAGEVEILRLERYGYYADDCFSCNKIRLFFPPH